MAQQLFFYSHDVRVVGLLGLCWAWLGLQNSAGLCWLGRSFHSWTKSMKQPLPGICSSHGWAPEFKGWENRGKLCRYLKASAPLAKGSHMVKYRVPAVEKYTMPARYVASCERITQPITICAQGNACQSRYLAFRSSNCS